ncbi:MAG: CotS family spore coat protein [Clostridium sp.]
MSENFTSINDPSLLSEKNVKKHVLPKFNINNCTVEQIKFKDTVKQRAVYKVTTLEQCFCLKKIYYSQSTLLFVYSAIEWWYRHEINVPKLLNTKSKNRYVLYRDMLFILTPWINGERCDYNNPVHLYKIAVNLGKMHKHGKKFISIDGSTVNYKFDKIHISINKHLKNLTAYSNYAFEYKDDFSKLYLKHFNLMNEIATISSKSAASINYNNLTKTLCHGDYVNKNIIFTSDGETWVIDFDKTSIDYSMHDVGYALRRILRRDSTNWDIELLLKWIYVYNEYSEITVDDYKYLLSYLAFPQKYWKIARDYYTYIDKCNKPAFLSLLCKSLKSSREHYDFVISFKAYIEYKFNILL